MIYLCGHTGSENRGCEAIVRGTLTCFELQDACWQTEDMVLMTFNLAQDEACQLTDEIKVIPYANYPTQLHRYVSIAGRRFFHRLSAGQKYIQAPLWNRIRKGDVACAVGGDTYCYGVPYSHIALNQEMKNRGIPTILWCCSLERNLLSGQIIDDLKRYTYVVAREQITYENLLDIGISKDKIIKCCDPAFQLKMKKIALPQNFLPGNTVGLNISNMVNDSEGVTISNVEYLIEYIIRDMGMNICLIPHVYNVEKRTGDIDILDTFYDKYRNTGKVAYVNEDYTCEELKYIISQCRFFVGARTHSTIAAYSTMVPTLVIGYSVKSLGIAKDLFGQYEGYVLPYNKLQRKDDLLSTFLKLVEDENAIKEQYQRILPEYINTVAAAVKKVRELEDN